MAKTNEEKLLEKIADSLQYIKHDIRKILELGERAKRMENRLNNVEENEDE